jgi:L-fuconolactonase
MPALQPNDMTEPVLEPDLPICDPHHHLWVREGWPRYLLDEFAEDIRKAGHRIEETVFVEAHAFYSPLRPEGFEFVAETEAMAGIAAMAESGAWGPTRICAGIVGRAELRMGGRVAEVLEAHLAAGAGRVRGIRAAGAWHPGDAIRNSHTSPPPGLYGMVDFREGFACLKDYGLSFEAWQYHTQITDVIDLARAFPDTQIMLNHAGGPLGIGPYKGKRDEVFAAWAADIREIGKLPNVHVKLGGLGMPINGFEFHKRPSPPGSEELAATWRPYIETCIEAFGVDRAVFESNFPVDRTSCSYGVLWNAFKRIADRCSAAEKARLFRDNALRFYRL